MQSGDSVYVPDLAERLDSAPTDLTHVFVRGPSIIAAIRFVHGALGTAIRDDLELLHLEISNYRTDRAGADGLSAFAGPAHWQFDTNCDMDPDTFKVEVTDTRTGKAQLDVTLEALHPVYVAGVAIGTDLNWSSPAERARRKLEVKVHRATPKPDQRFRSAYLRLVVDESDHAAVPSQTLLVTDDQPNEEQVEILDQEIRATYKIDDCPRAGTDAQCRVTAQVPVGSNKQRINICVGIIRRNVGDATGFHGVTGAHIRHRLFRWFRRVYAQADMAPTLVDPGIRLLDPPERSMLTVSNITGNRAHGRTPGGASPSRMSFTIATSRGGVAPKPVVLDIPLPASPAARPTPKDVADLLVAQINDADFAAEAFENPPAQGRLATQRSADVVVRDTGGGRVTISAASSTDRSASLRLAVVNLNSVTDHSTLDVEYGTIEQRQIMRNFHTGDDRLNCYVVGRFGDPDTRGRSFTPCYDLDARYQPDPPVPFTCMMASTSSSGHVMDGSDNLPYTFPHEAGHALLDCFHATRRTELMAGGGTSVAPRLRGTKRICDTPVRVVYGNYHPVQTFVGRIGSFFYPAATRLATLAAGLSAAVFEAW